MSVEKNNEHQVPSQSGTSLTETLTLFKAVYGEQVMSRTQVFEWQKRFSTDRDDPMLVMTPSLDSSTSRTEANIENVKGLIRCDHRHDDG